MQPPHTTPAFGSATFLQSSHHPAGKATTPAYTPRIGSPEIHIRHLILLSNHSQISTPCFAITIGKHGCHFCDRAGIFGSSYTSSASSILFPRRKHWQFENLSSHAVWCRMRSIQSSRYPYTRTCLGTYLLNHMHFCTKILAGVV